MNILFFLTPKSDVAYISEEESLKQAMDKMEFHKYSAVPIIGKQGQYVGTLTEGDLLWYIKNQLCLSLAEAKRIQVTDVPRRSDNTPVRVDSRMEDLLNMAMQQNFVPVLDDKKSFIGIVTRKDIMKYFADHYRKSEPGAGGTAKSGMK